MTQPLDLKVNVDYFRLYFLILGDPLNRGF